MFCPECGGPSFADPVRKKSICPLCYVPSLGECDLQFSWRQTQELVFALVLREGSQKKAAEALGVSPQYLNDIMRGRREISDAVAAKFGLERVVVYMQRMAPFDEDGAKLPA